MCVGRAPQKISVSKMKKKTRMETHNTLRTNIVRHLRTYNLPGVLCAGSIRSMCDVQAVVVGHNIARSLKMLPSASRASVRLNIRIFDSQAVSIESHSNRAFPNSSKDGFITSYVKLISDYRLQRSTHC